MAGLLSVWDAVSLEGELSWQRVLTDGEGSEPRPSGGRVDRSRGQA
jgi:hypothetical protein